MMYSIVLSPTHPLIKNLAGVCHLFVQFLFLMLMLTKCVYVTI